MTRMCANCSIIVFIGLRVPEERTDTKWEKRNLRCRLSLYWKRTLLRNKWLSNWGSTKRQLNDWRQDQGHLRATSVRNSRFLHLVVLRNSLPDHRSAVKPALSSPTEQFKDFTRLSWLLVCPLFTRVHRVVRLQFAQTLGIWTIE